MSVRGRVLRFGVLSLVWCAVTGSTVENGAVRRAEQAAEAYRQGRFAAALRLYREAQVESPGSPELHFNVGDALYRTGDLHDALLEYRQAAAGGDTELRSRALYNQGNVHLRLRHPAEAVMAYTGALELTPGDRNSVANLELALRALRRQEHPGGHTGGGSQTPSQPQPQPETPSHVSLPAAPADDGDAHMPNGASESTIHPTISPRMRDGALGRDAAEQLLDALRDRELAAQRRRFGPPLPVTGEDW